MNPLQVNGMENTDLTECFKNFIYTYILKGQLWILIM